MQQASQVHAQMAFVNQKRRPKQNKIQKNCDVCKIPPSGIWETIDCILLENEGSKKNGKLILFEELVCLTRCGVALIRQPVLCSKASPKLTTKEPCIGGASIHEPFASFTCNPPLLSWSSSVK